MDEPGLCRVVCVRADGARVIIDDGLSTERAHHIRMLLVAANAFPDVSVEPDGTGKPDDPPNPH
jgi:hypothetical protein